MSRARRSLSRALRLDHSSLVQGGLAFLLAYTIAYVVNAI
jgi:hypothetical protein